MKPAARVLIRLLAVFAAATPLPGAQWQAGVATIIITPAQPVPMAGYASRTRPFERVEHDIFAKALALMDAEGHRAVLVTTDLVGIPGPIAKPICDAIQQQTGLARAQILLSSSHTHSAPLLTEDEQTRYDQIAPEDGRNLLAYTRNLQTNIVAVAVRALASLEPVHLSRGQGIAHFTMNRREHTANGMTLGVNPRGLVDRSLPVLRVAKPNGELLAVLFSYACHNTTLTGQNSALCGDYAGFAQYHIESQFPSATALFMMGCGGDANPFPRGTMAIAKDHGTALGQEVCRLLQTPENLQPVSGPLTCQFDHADLPLQSFGRQELLNLHRNGPGWARANAGQLLQQLAQNSRLPETFAAPVAVWQFGSSLTLVGLSGEVVVDYVPLIEKAIGPLQLWITAYCNDVFGYVPSQNVLQEGGYECRGLYIAPGFFAPATQDVLVDKVSALARAAGRPQH